MQLVASSHFASLRKGLLLLCAFLGVSALRRWLRGKAAEAGLAGFTPPSGDRRRSSRGNAPVRQGGSAAVVQPRQGSAAGAGPSAPPWRAAEGNVRRSEPKAVAGRERQASPPPRPFQGAASEAEVGPAWHCGGVRRWLWFHDGVKSNGWIELGAGGTMRLSFKVHGSARWAPRGADGLTITFGRCHHDVELLPDSKVPTFVVRDRRMRDGSVSRPQRGKPTKGVLDLGGSGPRLWGQWEQPDCQQYQPKELRRQQQQPLQQVPLQQLPVQQAPPAQQPALQPRPEPTPQGQPQPCAQQLPAPQPPAPQAPAPQALQQEEEPPPQQRRVEEQREAQQPRPRPPRRPSSREPPLPNGVPPSIAPPPSPRPVSAGPRPGGAPPSEGAEAPPEPGGSEPGAAAAAGAPAEAAGVPAGADAGGSSSGAGATPEGRPKAPPDLPAHDDLDPWCTADPWAQASRAN